MKRILFCTLSLFAISMTDAQLNQPNTNNLTPVTPSAFEFLKYTEMPVSDYMGIPNISVPIYQIEEDGIKIPLGLTYHSNGIRVNQEASWVGLGWDMTFGSIIQTVNDLDDYPESNNDGIPPPYTKQQPDYAQSPPLGGFPMRYNYPFLSDGYGWHNPYNTVAFNRQFSYMVVTDYYVPVNGNFAVRRTDLFTNSSCDKEPDLFRANFLGHSISFILDWKTNQFVVLNKKGYKITRNSNTSWMITDPSGECFYFEALDVVKMASGDNFGNTHAATTSSKIWMLTKIVTKNQKQIVFNYVTGAVHNVYPSYSERSDNYTSLGVSSLLPNPLNQSPSFGTGYYGMVAINGITKSYSTSTESTLTLSSIVFPKGQVNFTTSQRNDILTMQKLDRVDIVSPAAIIKSFQFNYGYFDATNSQGNGYNITEEASTYGSTGSYRLKLLSMQDNSGAVYSFAYDPTPLPKKNSFAMDYWGYYNGQLSNTSLIPNPSQFNKPDLGNNGDNHSANLSFARAGILTAIQYPTGGSVNLGYELNQFDNYWVPDFSSSVNTISNGNGLRINTIKFMSDANTVSKELDYSYSGGKAIQPVNLLFRQFNFNTINPGITAAATTVQTFRDDQISSSSFFSSNMLGSINGVGYGSVTKQEIDGSGATNGKTVSIFNNTPDLVTNSATNGFAQLSASLPAVKDWSQPENGSVQSISYYDNQNTLLKKVENTYSNVVSPVSYYGAKIFGYLNYYIDVGGNQGSQNYAQNLIGYYPIFDFETLLQISTSTDYANGIAMPVTTTYSYDSYNQVTTTISNNSKGTNDETDYYYPYSSYFGTTSWGAALIAANRLDEQVQVYRIVGSTGANSWYKSFAQQGGAILESELDVYPHIKPYGAGIPEVTTFDLYDGNANLLQYTTNTLPTSFLYGYNSQYPIAKVSGSGYATVSAMIDQGVLNNPSDDNALRTELDKVRSGLKGTNALVTTYTYSPLVGISSQTDPAGHTTYYSYDSFGRLKTLKDQDGHIIKTFDYQYQQPH